MFQKKKITTAEEGAKRPEAVLSKRSPMSEKSEATEALQERKVTPERAGGGAIFLQRTIVLDCLGCYNESRIFKKESRRTGDRIRNVDRKRRVDHAGDGMG